MKLKSSVFLSVLVLILSSSSGVYAGTVESFTQRVITKYNQEPLKAFGGNWIPSKEFMRGRETDYQKYIYSPSLVIFDQEIKNTDFEKINFPTIDKWDNSPKDISSLEIFTYIRLLEINVPLTQIQEEEFKKFISYKVALLRPRGKLFQAVLDYVEQDKNSYMAYESSGTYEFLTRKTLIHYYKKGVNSDIIFQMIYPYTSDFNYSSTRDYEILDMMKGHKEQVNFAKKMADGLEFLRTCKKAEHDPSCPGPKAEYAEDIQKLQNEYGPFQIKDYSNNNRECPCSGE